MMPTPETARQAYRDPVLRWLPFARSRMRTVNVDSAPARIYGPGSSSHWDIQAQATAATAFAVASADPDTPSADADDHARTALALMRYLFASHAAGGGTCLDGQSWGRSWISVLALERLTPALALLDQRFTKEDRARIDAVAVDEAQTIPTVFPVSAAPEASTGKNHPESNMWCGAFLHRAAMERPGHPDAPAWRARGADYLANAISVPEDADDSTMLDGRTVADRHVGANFFSSYACNHHGYLNVGYMVVTLSNLALLDFACRDAGAATPTVAAYHAEALWRLVKRATFPSGRLWRWGGDTRVRYAYCQDYAVPVWLWAVERFGDADAASWLRRWPTVVASEARDNDDGSFFGQRLRSLNAVSPLYRLRLEGDRAACLAMAAWRMRLQPLSYAAVDDGERTPVKGNGTGASGVDPARVHGSMGAPSSIPVPATSMASESTRAADLSDASSSRAGPGATGDAPEGPSDSVFTERSWDWADEFHGAFVTRGRRRAASWCWESAEKPAGVCVPLDRDDMAEWRYAWSGQVRGMGVDEDARRVDYKAGRTFPGGFVTWGRYIARTEPTWSEGARPHDTAVVDVAVAALPDDATMLVMQRARSPHGMGLSERKGMYWPLPNDFANGRTRRVRTAEGERTWTTPTSHAATGESLNSPWLVVDGRMALAGVYGDTTWRRFRPALARGHIRGPMHTVRAHGSGGELAIEELCWGSAYEGTARYPDPGATLWDAACAVRILDVDETAFDAPAWQTEGRGPAADSLPVDVRWATVLDRKGRRYTMAVNWGDTPVDARSTGLPWDESATDATGAEDPPGRLPARTARLWMG